MIYTILIAYFQEAYSSLRHAGRNIENELQAENLPAVLRKAQNSMPNVFTKLKLGPKIALLGIGSVALTALALVWLSIWQSNLYNQLAQSEVDDLINADLNHITQSVYNLVHTENEAVQLQVDANLNVARHLLHRAGGAKLSTSRMVSWDVVNQFTNISEELTLPQFVVGDLWLGQNKDLSVETPIVDSVTELVGETATIFQRMNGQGDMLRVATTVPMLSQERAIGTFIPAVNPDGKANTVVSTILKGETYHGRAYVVNSWYLTAYEPIKDNTGAIIGMLYVGVKQKIVAARIRNAILQQKIGKSGYVYVIGGIGQERGRYIISNNGERDGEDIWNVQDSDSNFVIQDIINKATSLGNGEMATIRYRWQNPGEHSPRWKIARLVYYAPWDWIIGTSVYDDELQAYSTHLTSGQKRMSQIMILAGMALIVLIGMLSTFVAWTISHPVRQMTEVAKQVIAGDLSRMAPETSHDEIGVLARTFNLMTAKLKESMDELRKSEEQYRGIFENAIEGLFQSTVQGRFLNANPALAQILGYSTPDELMSSVTDIKHQLYVNPEVREELVRLVIENQRVAGLEVQFYRKDKSWIWVSISARMIVDDQGNPKIIEGFIADINGRKRMEEALEESRNYLDEIINSVADPIFVKNQQHRWTLVNNAFCALMGRPREEIIGRSDYDYKLKQEADVFLEDDLVFSRGTANINEEQFPDNSGNIHTLVTKKTLYTDKQGEKFIVGIVRDITDLKRAEEERRQLEARLSQSQKMEAIGTLAGGIAHDFNNILQPMLGYGELLRLHLPADSPHLLYVERLYTASLRAKNLVNQILAISRQSERNITPVSVPIILKEVLKLCRSTIPSNIQISTSIQQDCPPVMLDPSQLHQIVMNLIINAYHAVEKNNGSITINLQECTVKATAEGSDVVAPSRYARLSVIDTGCGIEPAIMEKIFEPYFTTKIQGKGTGLGLSVVYGIVKELQGDIKLHSILDEGTTIDVYLPLTESSPDRKAVVVKSYPAGSGHVLLVDDEELIIEVEKLILESLGYQVTAHVSSIDALNTFKKDPDAFDIVITDLTMPSLTGDKLAKALFAIRPELPVIICSGFSEILSDEEAESLGVKQFLRKPVTREEMSHKVRLALEERKTSQ